MIPILVLGGTGFLGHNLQESFSNHNLQGAFIGRGQNDEYNLLDYQKTRKLFLDTKPDIVVFASANVGGIEYNKNNPGALIRDNLQIGINVFDACREFNIHNMYCTGTCCSYPKYCPIPFKEEDLYNGPEESTNSGYGIAKKAMIKMSESYRQQYGLKSTCFILANMYGKFDNFKDESSHVVPALIKKFLYAKENGLPEVRCFGSGEATRDLLNAADAAECLTKAIMTGFDYPSPINIGTGVETSIKSIAETIKRLTGYDGQIVFTGEVSDGQPRRCLDTTKARDLLGWESSITLENGLFDTIDWYISS